MLWWAWSSVNRKPSTLSVSCRNRWQHYQASHSSIIYHSFSWAVHRYLRVCLCVLVHSLLLGKVTLRRLAVKRVCTLKRSCPDFRSAVFFCLSTETLDCTCICMLQQCVGLKEKEDYPISSAKCERKTYHGMMDAVCQLLWKLRLLKVAQCWWCLSKPKFSLYSLYPFEALEERKCRCVVSISTHHLSPSLCPSL